MYDRRLFAIFPVKLLEILLKKRLSFGASVYNFPNTAIELGGAIT